jgi:hypothetical protein
MYSLKGSTGDFNIDYDSVSPKNILIENNFFGNTDKYAITQTDAIGAWRNTDGLLIKNLRFKNNTLAKNANGDIHCVGNYNRQNTLDTDCFFEGSTVKAITPLMRGEFYDELFNRINTK